MAYCLRPTQPESGAVVRAHHLLGSHRLAAVLGATALLVVALEHWRPNKQVVEARTQAMSSLAIRATAPGMLLLLLQLLLLQLWLRCCAAEAHRPCTPNARDAD